MLYCLLKQEIKICIKKLKHLLSPVEKTEAEIVIKNLILKVEKIKKLLKSRNYKEKEYLNSKKKKNGSKRKIIKVEMENFKKLDKGT